jgi:2-aminophenol/2-amino-5-chlorophenol 1,6-dioxygenase alpha subunit
VARGEVVAAYLVPGLAPLAVGADAGPWADLRRACREAAAAIDRLRPDVLVLWSSQWISVLGHLFQALPNPKGVHVDDNWYAMGDFPFDVRVDVDLVRAAVAASEARSLQARAVAYEGFPLDTGTLVAHGILNAASRPLACVSCNIYAGAAEERQLGAAAAEAVASLGRRAVAICVSGLSSHVTTKDVEPREDRVPTADDAWNRRVLDAIAAGDNASAEAMAPEFARQAGADMMFKGFSWLLGAAGRTDAPGRVLGYGPLWGTGAAVVEWNLSA